MFLFNFVPEQDDEFAPHDLPSTSPIAARVVGAGIGYRIMLRDSPLGNWHDELFVEMRLVNDDTGSTIFYEKISMYDFSTTPLPGTYEDTKLRTGGPTNLQSGLYTLHIRGKFAAISLIRGYVVFAGGAEVYVDGALIARVTFVPSRERPNGEETRTFQFSRE